MPRQSRADGGAEAVVQALQALPIVLVGKKNCAYSLEAESALCAAAARIGGKEAVCCLWLDSLPSGAAIWGALKQVTG